MPWFTGASSLNPISQYLLNNSGAPNSYQIRFITQQNVIKTALLMFNGDCSKM